MANVPVLGYWDIRGLAQPIRLLLEYTGTKFDDKRYVCGEAPDYDRSDWTKVKFTLGFDFPNLPYYCHESVRLTESGAILRHLARQHGLTGATEQEKCRADLLEYTMNDFRSGFSELCYGSDFETNKVRYLEILPSKLKLFSDFLGTRKYFAGENITFPDFIAYETLDQHLIFEPSCLKEFPNLEAFLKNIEALEPIKAYLASPRCIKKRINDRTAHFGSGV
ncbi:Glutathione S-transferase C-terminal [Trinorchestia longiramus]|nr:Glutathione S-transferase C-terminal [Trinorchestia longiramus]